MPRHVFILFLAWIVPALVEVRADSWSGKSVDFSHGDLCVSPNGRFLQHTDGTPFLYLGDTAWELIYRLNEPEVELYMENRRAKGFTVIQTVILSELDGSDGINRPLINGSPSTPDPDYFKWPRYGKLHNAIRRHLCRSTRRRPHKGRGCPCS